MQDVNITISTSTIIKIVAIACVLYLVYLVGEILLLLFVAVILASLIDPFASWLQKHRFPRAIAVIVTYIGLLGILGTTIAVLTPVIARDAPQIVGNIGALWQELQTNENWLGITEGLQRFQGTLDEYGLSFSGAGSVGGADVGATVENVFSTVTGFFGGVVSLILVLVMTFYLVSQDDPVKKMLRSIVPDEYLPYATKLVKRMRDKLGLWIRGQLILSVIIGLMVFVGLMILGVEYAAVLGLIAALFEFVPYLGPVMAAVPALIIAFSQGGAVKMVFVLIMYVVIQQIENNILVPKVMQKAVGLNPIVSILAILVGAELAGVVGALVAIPVATALSVFFKDVLAKDPQRR